MSHARFSSHVFISACNSAHCGIAGIHIVRAGRTGYRVLQASLG